MDLSKPGKDPINKAIAIVGPANSGKTGLICRLLGHFRDRGLKVAVLKHSHKPGLGDDGKDTGRYGRAGAKDVALAAPGLLRLTRLLDHDPPAEEVLAAWSPPADLILVEGYKSSSLPKISLVGPGLEQVLPDDARVIALVSSGPREARVPVFRPHQVAELADFILNFIKAPQK
jgi:molybdopterin-guanine dinucleotide biosynthesis protein MobB